MRKRWVIPDIHGCHKTLKSLIEELIKPSRYDELYFLGDYIDRGPDSQKVIDYIRFLQKDEYTITALPKSRHGAFGGTTSLTAKRWPGLPMAADQPWRVSVSVRSMRSRMIISTG